MSDDDSWYGPRRPSPKLTQSYIDRKGAQIKEQTEKKNAAEARRAERAEIKAEKEAREKEAEAAQVSLFDL